MHAYIVGMVSINDPEKYKTYAEKTPALVAKHGGKFLVRGGNVNALEGETFNDRMVIIEFPSQQARNSFYNDPDYQQAMLIRQSASDGRILAADGIE